MDLHIIFQLLLITFIGFVVGLEREVNHQPAGIRTHILIGLGSTLLMILSIEMSKLSHVMVADPGRIAAQVVTGIGFIGAGAIMKLGLNTKGLATAANVWVMSAIGLLVGASLYLLAILGTLLILFTLVYVDKLKWKIVKRKRYVTIKIVCSKKQVGSSTKIHKKLNELNLDIISEEIKETSSNITVTVVLMLKTTINIYEIRENLKDLLKIAKIEISETIK